MEYYISQKSTAPGEGTLQNPFTTVGQAARVAGPGDRIIIGGGIYREWINPARGGSDDAQRITYTAAPGESPVISGAEVVANWENTGNGVWKTTLQNRVFGSYNPFADPIFGDWYNDLGQVHHTGEVYLDGRAMYEVDLPEKLAVKFPPAAGEKAFRWFARVSESQTEIWGQFGDLNPNQHLTEVNARPFCFFPQAEGINYITVSGLTFEKAATQWAPPTAFQPGIIGPHWSKGWIIENCVVRNSKCAGISLGKRRDVKDNIWSLNPEKGGAQTYTEIIFLNIKNGWSKDKVGSHLLRNNEIYDCGQTGIVGNMGGAFSTIRGNHIHHINVRGEFGGAEIGGIKLHSAVDAVLEDNCIHDCYRGVWLDWQAQGVRVSRNAFFANNVEDLFIEVSHGPCVVDNNLFLSPINLENWSQGSAFGHNLFTGEVHLHRETNRFTLYHLPHDTFVGGVMLIYGGDDKVANNIYLGRSEAGVRFGNCLYNDYPDKNAPAIQLKDDHPMAFAEKTLPVDIHDNVYFNGAQKYEHESGAVEVDGFKVAFAVEQVGSDFYLTTNLGEWNLGKAVDYLTTARLGRSFESEEAYENADGTELVVDMDFTGNRREGEKTSVGPFAQAVGKVRLNK
jgi:alpha-L-arabinofuranosidase